MQSRPCKLNDTVRVVDTCDQETARTRLIHCMHANLNALAATLASHKQ